MKQKPMEQKEGQKLFFMFTLRLTINSENSFMIS